MPFGGCVFGRFAVGDVPHNLGRPDDPACLILDGRDGQGNPDGLAVAPQPYRVEVFDPLSGFQGRYDPILFGGPVGGDDEGDVTPHGLLCRIAEDPLGGGVPALDDAVQRLADDGILRRLDDGRQQAIGEPENHAPIGSAVVHEVYTLRGSGAPHLALSS